MTRISFQMQPSHIDCRVLIDGCRVSRLSPCPPSQVNSIEGTLYTAYATLGDCVVSEATLAPMKQLRPKRRSLFSSSTSLPQSRLLSYGLFPESEDEECGRRAMHPLRTRNPSSDFNSRRISRRLHIVMTLVGSSS